MTSSLDFILLLPTFSNILKIHPHLKLKVTNQKLPDRENFMDYLLLYQKKKKKPTHITHTHIWITYSEIWNSLLISKIFSRSKPAAHEKAILLEEPSYLLLSIPFLCNSFHWPSNPDCDFHLKLQGTWIAFSKVNHEVISKLMSCLHMWGKKCQLLHSINMKTSVICPTCGLESEAPSTAGSKLSLSSLDSKRIT